MAQPLERRVNLPCRDRASEATLECRGMNAARTRVLATQRENLSHSTRYTDLVVRLLPAWTYGGTPQHHWLAPVWLRSASSRNDDIVMAQDANNTHQSLDTRECQIGLRLVMAS